VYFFCECYKSFTYINDDIEKDSNTELIKKIFNLLLSDESKEKNKLNKARIHNLSLTKARREHYGIPALLKEEDMKLTDWLIETEREIAIYENTYKEDGASRKHSQVTSSKSYLIDVVFRNKPSRYNPTTTSSFFDTWVEVGKKLKDFIITEHFYYLTVIDGLDNIIFNDSKNIDDLREFLKQLHHYTLDLSKTGSDYELKLIAMRVNTFEELKKINTGYRVSARKVRLNTAYVINIEQNVNFIAREILIKRVEGFVEKNQAYINKHNSILNKMLVEVKDYHATSVDHEKWWDSNIRSFLCNHLELARWLTFQHYLHEKSSKDKGEVGIKPLIDVFESINFYLSGDMFACDKLIVGDEDGTTCFNLFGYINEKSSFTPKYTLIYTYLLKVIMALENNQRHKKNIDSILFILGYPKNDAYRCLIKLVSNGMISQKYEERKTLYNVTEKGKFLLNKFYNDIEYLYFSSFDTYLPDHIYESVNKRISPYNREYYAGDDRNFNPLCIIGGITFLHYLKYLSDTMAKKCDNPRVKNDLSKFNLDEDLFQLPIMKEQSEDSLYHSVGFMLEKINKSENNKKAQYLSILKEWMIAYNV
jgi:predicted transcriptional regulator